MRWPPEIADVDQIDESWGEDPVLAIDAHLGYAAGFRFSIRKGGECYIDVFFGRLRSDGGFEEMGSGGWSGGWPPAPWRPPIDGWDGDAVMRLGSFRLDVEDDDENEMQLLALPGFAAPYASGKPVGPRETYEGWRPTPQ